jgi:hypothetical protein
MASSADDRRLILRTLWRVGLVARRERVAGSAQQTLEVAAAAAAGVIVRI